MCELSQGEREKIEIALIDPLHKPVDWPEHVKYLPGSKGRGRWYDTETGRFTHPSWVMRGVPGLIDPEDVGKRRRRATREDEALCRTLEAQLKNQGLDTREGVNTRQAIDALMVVSELTRKKAKTRLHEMWQAGLLQLEAALHLQSDRPYNQRWSIPT